MTIAGIEPALDQHDLFKVPAIFKPNYIFAAIFLYLIGMGLYNLTMALTRRRPGFRWVRTAMGLLAAFAIICGVLGLVIHCTNIPWTKATDVRVHQFEHISQGGVVALLLLLLLSPGFYRFVSRRPPDLAVAPKSSETALWSAPRTLIRPTGRASFAAQPVKRLAAL